MNKPNEPTNRNGVYMNRIDKLKAEAQQVASAFHVIGQGTFPGAASPNVVSALTYLDNLHTKLQKKIEKSAPPVVAEETPVSAEQA
jgi:hypothetical protein